jgi:hypothetical protein
LYGTLSDEAIISTLLDEDPSLGDLICKFADKLPVMVEDIRQSCHEQRWQSLKGQLHDLKGIGSFYGYPVLTELSANMELELHAGRHGALPPLLGRLDELCRRICQGVRDLER